MSETYCRCEHIIIEFHCSFGVVWLYVGFQQSHIKVTISFATAGGTALWKSLPFFCPKCRICSGISLHSLKDLKCQ